MDLTTLRSLIDSYIVDNQAQGITPAKFRSILQTITDYFETIEGGGGGIIYDGVGETDYTLYDAFAVRSIAFGDRVQYDYLGNPTLDYSSGNLIAASDVAVVNWMIQNLRDNTGVISQDWNGRGLYNSGGLMTVDYENQQLWQRGISDSVSVDFGEWALQFVGHTTVDWHNANLISYSSDVATVRWMSGILADNSGQFSMNWFDRLAIDAAGHTSIDYDNRWLLRAEGQQMLDYENGVLFDTRNYGSIQFDTRYFIDSTNTVSGNYDGRVLLDTNGYVSNDWGVRKMYDSNVLRVLSIDYENRELSDNAGVLSANWQGRAVFDNTGNAAIRFGAVRQLCNSVTATVLDWETGQSFDNSGGLSIDNQNRIMYDAGGAYSIHYQNRFLINDANFNVARWHRQNSKNVLEIVTGAYLQVDDTYAGNTVAATAQTPSITHGYGSTATGVLGQPTKWFQIVDSAGVVYNVPAY